MTTRLEEMVQEFREAWSGARFGLTAIPGDLVDRMCDIYKSDLQEYALSCVPGVGYTRCEECQGGITKSCDCEGWDAACEAMRKNISGEV